MRITVGVLAFNEADRIANTINSLLAQSVFSGTSHSGLNEAFWEIVVVPNGCTDSTAVVAASALERGLRTVNAVALEFRVVETTVKGKSNAWNFLIHELLNPNTDIVVMMDADIEYGHEKTIENSVRTLLSAHPGSVVVDTPIKSFARLPRKSVIQRLSLRASRDTEQAPPGIAGSFYCAYAAFLKRVTLPLGLPVEDGFLCAMVQTDCFRAPPCPERVIRARDASHYYEGLDRLQAIVEHEVRLVIGTTLNYYLCWNALNFLTPSNGDGAGSTISALNDSKPNWYRQHMENEIKSRGLWVLPPGMLWRRFRGMRGRRLVDAITALPWRCIAFVFDLVVMFRANAKLRSGRGVGFW